MRISLVINHVEKWWPSKLHDRGWRISTSTVDNVIRLIVRRWPVEIIVSAARLLANTRVHGRLANKPSNFQGILQVRRLACQAGRQYGWIVLTLVGRSLARNATCCIVLPSTVAGLFLSLFLLLLYLLSYKQRENRLVREVILNLLHILRILRFQEEKNRVCSARFKATFKGCPSWALLVPYSLIRRFLWIKFAHLVNRCNDFGWAKERIIFYYVFVVIWIRVRKICKIFYN